MPLSTVPQFRQDVAFTSVVAGAPVASTDWQRVAAVQNWIAGRGRQVIPTFKPDHGSNKNTTFRYSLYILPSYPTIDLVAMAATKPLQTVALPGSVPAPVPIALSVSPRGAYSSSAITLDLDIVAPINPDITVESIAVYEIPRAQIEQTALAGGVDAIALAPSQPITIASVDAIRDAVDDDVFGARVLAFHAVPYSNGSGTITTYATASTSATYAPVVGGNGVPVLARKKRTADTTRTVKARCYGWVTGATTGEFRVTSSVNGSSSAASFTSTSPAWSSEITNLVVDCEDLTTSDGLQGGVFDELTCEARRSAGAGTVYVAGWIVYE
jgi:hypothetical protein